MLKCKFRDISTRCKLTGKICKERNYKNCDDYIDNNIDRSKLI